jgi:hypothetical protein
MVIVGTCSLSAHNERRSRTLVSAGLQVGRPLAEELAEIHRLAPGARRLSDIELQEMLYLAGRLLATVTDWSIAAVNNFEID